MRTGVAPECASKSALGQSQSSDSGTGQEGRSQTGELRFVPRCLTDKKLNDWIIGNRDDRFQTRVPLRTGTNKIGL
jgi:hypothetical protein